MFQVVMSFGNQQWFDYVCKPYDQVFVWLTWALCEIACLLPKVLKSLKHARWFPTKPEKILLYMQICH